MFVGREKEKKILQNAFHDEQSHFVAVYGRRRIGKTFMVRETFNYSFTFQHAGLASGTMSEQLFAFTASLKDAGFESGKKPGNWMEAFEMLKDLIRQSTEKKKVIFIDELSWMDTRKSDLLVALENFWNGWASARKDILLIVCASATSWILSKVIHNKGGLYNRLTDQIHLQAFSLAECEEYVKAKDIILNRNQILEYYMVFGGVPYYWSFLEKGKSVPQNIDRIMFEQDAPLRDEFRYLFQSLFRNPDVHIRIIQALGKKKVGMTREEIIAETGIINSGDLTIKLGELESCGFIRKYNAYGMKSRNAVYQLIDCFTLFYFRFIEGKTAVANYWINQINTPAVNSWKGLAFERVCLIHTPQIKRSLGIDGILTEVNSWYCREDKEKGVKGSQIDLIIVRKDQVINLCEMKYSAAEYTVSENDERDIRRRLTDLVISTGTKYAVNPTLVTTYGMVENMHSGIFQSVVTMDSLFEK